MIINYAHRGASGYFPENTMLAFEKALPMGATGIETDVQMTKDGVLVLIHDETLDRTTNVTGFVKDYTYKELLKIDAGSHFSSEFKNVKIPALDELIQFAKDKNLQLNLELKNNIIQYPKIEEKVLDMIEKYKIKDRIIISSFNHYSMVKVKEIDKETKVGLLYSATLYHPENYGKALGVEALHPLYFAVDSEEIIQGIKAAGLMINPYTIDDEGDMRRFIDYGVDGIITDYPDKLSKLLHDWITLCCIFHSLKWSVFFFRCPFVYICHIW